MPFVLFFVAQKEQFLFAENDGVQLRLDSGFQVPPDSAKLWAFWWWLNGNVDKESISNDLSEMRRQGFGGALIFCGDGSSQDGNARVSVGAVYGSREWRELYKHALQEAARLGLSISLTIQSGWNLGGPTVTPEYATKRIVWTETIIQNENAEIVLPQPAMKNNYYRDIAVVAVPIKSREIETTQHNPTNQAVPTASSQHSRQFAPNNATDNNTKTFWVSNGTKKTEGTNENKTEWFDLSFQKQIRATGIVIEPRVGYGPKLCELLTSADGGKTFTSIKKFDVKKNSATIIQFDPVSSKIYRLAIFDSFDPQFPNSPRNVQIAEVALLNGNQRIGISQNPESKRRPLDLLTEKTAVKEYVGSAPNCDLFLADEREIPDEVDANVNDVKIIAEGKTLENAVDQKTGVLKLPPLKEQNLKERDPQKTNAWVVIRFGCTNTGAVVSTSSGNWQGLVLDHLDAESFDIYWDVNVQPVIDDAGELAGKTLRYIMTDSWELGGLNWTKTMREEFLKRRGYDLIPYLPILTGRILDNREVSNRFLFDLRRTVGDLVADNHYGRMKSRARAFGIGIHPESGGPHGAPIDSLQLLGMNDIPMSEFWSMSPRHRVGERNRFFTKQPASAAHTHGKRLVAAEGFTNIGMHWQESFADNLKPSFDQAVCEGCNLLVWCCFVSSPKKAGLPGQEFFAGTHFNPQHTLWNYSADFLTYINRVQFLTQQGFYAADVVQYYGDNVPNFTQGEWNNNAQSLPDYAYDVASMDAVLKMSVNNGRIFLPDGMNYKILVLPNVSGINLNVLRKIEELVNDGATIIGAKPKRVSGLTNFPVADIEVKGIVEKLWGTENSARAIRNVGKGRVVWGMTSAELLRNDNLPPDVSRLSGSLPDGKHRIKWIHRTMYDHFVFGGKVAELSPINSILTRNVKPDDAFDSENRNRTEIYFLANLTAEVDKTETAFRVTKKQPEIWNPVTGEIADAKAFRQENGQTIVPLEFAPNGSVFVVFRKPILPDAKGNATDNSLQFEPLQTLDGTWTVSFDPKRGAPASVQFSELIDWTKHPDDGIKYYSGAAIYKKDFSFKKPDEPVYLDLGLVREMVRVRLNGKELGTLWSRPFQIDVTDVIREGDNHLELEVVNHWANRIIGDAKLPPSQRQTQTNIKRLTAETPLSESGLIGTVRLKLKK
ncbi:MAG: discoidin domain-containing protein [Planctomycetaceae bacterium]|nr:discoidin domain-containing protein [Planctomycetaceae bacterium]